MQGSHISWTPLEDLQQWSQTLAPPNELKPPLANEIERPRSAVSPDVTYVPADVETTDRKPKRKHKKRSIFLIILTVRYDPGALNDLCQERILSRARDCSLRVSFEMQALMCRVFVKHHTRSDRRCSGGKQVTTSKGTTAAFFDYYSISPSASTSTSSDL